MPLIAQSIIAGVQLTQYTPPPKASSPDVTLSRIAQLTSEGVESYEKHRPPPDALEVSEDAVFPLIVQFINDVLEE